MADTDKERIAAERKRISDKYLVEESKRPGPSARGIHHVALLSSNVEKTVQFYQGVLEFPFIEIFENRDYEGSNHFFFDLGHGNALAFFDFPGLDLGPYAEVLGGLHHVAISVEPERWKKLRANIEAAGIEYALHSEVSIYFRDPDGARIELIADPLGEMYGTRLLSWQD
jgi:catechol 2,3-dioxygenase-like lactoylglutathione lyase family enzyme